VFNKFRSLAMSSKSNKDQCLDLSNILQLLNIIDSEVKSRLKSV
jgi:hypothetical protein